MKSTGLIFVGLCLLPAGMLIGNPWLFGVGVATLLTGNYKLLTVMRHEFDVPESRTRTL